MPEADLILKNANVTTMDSGQPAAEMVAVKGDKIMMVAGNDSVESVRGAGTRVIDCQSRTVLPGFNDAHCHVFSLLRKLISIDLSPSSVSSISDIKAVISNQARNTPQGQWITGTDYNEFYLAEKRHPTRWDIDEVAPDHPVVLSHRSLHACVLNSLALSLAGINRATPEPPGALIDRDLGSGEPTGLLFEMLSYIRSGVMPLLSDTELTRGIALVNQHYLSRGITSLQDATVVNNLSRWQTYQRYKNDDKLKSRHYMMIGMEALDEIRQAGLTFGSGDSQLRLGGVKLVLTESTGELHPPQTELNRQALDIHRAGFQLAIHAEEPSTVEAAITALEYVQEQSTQSGRRHRVEHCSECPPRLLERLIKLQAVVVTQPPFLYYSGERYLATIPADRLQWLHRIGSFIDGGMTVAGSSDSPVVPDNPLDGIYAAVTRKAQSGQQLLPEECISASQALAMYTINAAYASFEEDDKGSITQGKLADMVVLSDDPTQIAPEQIRDIKVEMTIIGGKVVWEA